ncbi:MAG: hypothetical protein FJY10_06160 [Bacteroidetes bacterium]|nr:hypothetical protein [Bacteroidota bacterium]
MIRSFSLLAVVALLFFAACQQTPKEAEGPKADTALLAVLAFDSMAPANVDSIIWIEGTVFHTCKHGGKRLFLIDGPDSITVEVTTGPDIAAFDAALEGSRIKILGKVKELRVDDKYLNEWEAEIKKPAEEEKTGVHTAKKGHEDQGVEEKMAQVNKFREEMKAKGVDHLSFYSVEAINYMEMK